MVSLLYHWWKAVILNWNVSSFKATIGRYPKVYYFIIELGITFEVASGLRLRQRWLLGLSTYDSGIHAWNPRVDLLESYPRLVGILILLPRRLGIDNAWGNGDNWWIGSRTLSGMLETQLLWWCHTSFTRFKATGPLPLRRKPTNVFQDLPSLLVFSIVLLKVNGRVLLL